MRTLTIRMLALAALLPGVAPAQSFAQAPAAPSQEPAPSAVAQAPAPTSGASFCGTAVAPPAQLPPANSGPVVWVMGPCFMAQGNVSTVEPQTYLYYMQLRPSQPSQNIWIPYNEQAEQTIREDFHRLWNTNFLEDLRIEVTDYTFANGVVGKLVAYHLEERERVKITNYEGSKEIDRTKIEEQLRERGIELRLDSFVDEGVIRRIKTVLREMMAEKGFTNAVVDHKVTPVAGGPKLVNVTFNVSEGPKIKIRDVEFIGNTAKSDGTLQRKMKENKPKGLLGFITGGGTYQEAKFEEDADKIVEYYQNEGYVRARVGQPELKVLEDSEDGKERWVQLRIPITEGPRYRIGEFNIEGNTVVKSESLLPLFELKRGDWYSVKQVREGLRKAQEIYGSGGYMDFTGFPDLKPSDEAAAQEAKVPEFLAEVETDGTNGGAPKDPTVDVTMRLTEGQQFFVNRIVFTGNTTTRDNVIRREMRLVEGGVFNTESLKYSVRRLNQLGYFEQINEQDQRAMKVDKTPGRDNAVDVTLALKEQNRNQLTFGAGVSQYEGFFGQLAFQTANFLGRGESLTVSMQAGDRAQNYQLAFTEPFLFDRNITGGFDVYKRALQYIGYYTQKSTGGNLMFGFPVADFSRMFVTYSYEQVRMTDLNELFIDPFCFESPDGCTSISLNDLSTISPEALERVRRNPFVFDSLLIGEGGRRTVSKVTPSFVHNTIDNPIFPNAGKRLTAAIDLAMLGGNTQFYKPRVEGIWYRRHLPRTSFGLRLQGEYIAPVGGTETLPIFEKLFMGGEYSVRGFDIRSIGPSDPETGLVLGGNKSLLFNAEYLISIANPVRLILFYDAGQVVDEGQNFAMKHFRASTGAEVRFFMPVLNVPFRLIFAHNPRREGVLDNNFQPAKKFVFRFAVGSTF
jgi:outer membrane protein insertion porin family